MVPVQQLMELILEFALFPPSTWYLFLWSREVEVIHSSDPAFLQEYQQDLLRSDYHGKSRMEVLM
jgi:hypothetical protein